MYVRMVKISECPQRPAQCSICTCVALTLHLRYCGLTYGTFTRSLLYCMVTTTMKFLAHSDGYHCSFGVYLAAVINALVTNI